MLCSIVFRYFANDYSRGRYKFAIGHRRFRFPIFREAVARNSPTKWNVLCLTAGQLTNARRQGLPKTPFALQKLCLASRCYLFRGNLNCIRKTPFYFCLTRYRKKLLEAIVPEKLVSLKFLLRSCHKYYNVMYHLCMYKKNK